MGFFDELQQIKELSTRTSESIGGVYSDPFNEVAIITSVSDPKKLGRVKVEYQDGTTSDWVYVLGSGKGLLSAQLIGSSCLIGKAHGNSGDAFVLGFFNKNPNVSSGGAPVQLTLLDEQTDSYRSPQSPGDQGMRCNRGNAGRVYLLQNETNQDVVVCIRRNNPQTGGEEVWNWKSLTSSKWVEKGFDPGLQGQIATNYSEKKGIPECNQAMDGDVRNFSEDRKFRDFQIKCGKDENGSWNWKPNGATPVFFRTTLPDCTERLHGMDAILDEGLNSQRVSCLRYQGEMKWVNPGKREPIQFHRKDAPITKKEFLDSKKDVAALKDDSSSLGANDYVGNSAPQVLQTAAEAIPPASALQASKGFDGAKLLSDIAKAVVASNSTTGVDDIVSQISVALGGTGVIDDTTSAILNALGGIGSQLVAGVQSGNVNSALETIGRRALDQSIRALPPEVASVYFGYMAGGVAGAMDTAAALKLPFIPEEVAGVIRPALNAGASAVRSQPKAISSMVSSSVRAPGTKSLNETINATTSAVPATPKSASSINSMMSAGELGKVAQSLGSFSNLSSMAKLGGDLSSVPQMASTALQVVGLGKDFIKAFEGGISLDEIGSLLGSNPVTGLLSGLGAGLGLGGGGDECPCDPKCRKTKHSEDSDGNVLLEKCGNVLANSHSSYAPKGDPTDNNNNPVAKVLDLIPTKLGEELCVPNNLDLTKLIQNVKRLSEMADRLDGAKNADWPELWTEMMYTFETVEKAFKQADNNITKVESVERKLIDAQYRLINKLMVGNESFLSQTLLSIIETSKAIRDTYNYVQRLDNTKNGGIVGVTPTDSLVNVFKNITRIATLNSISKKEANFITSNFISKADEEWKSMEPGGGLVDVASFALGLVPVDLPAVFDKCATKRDKSKALSDSISSKINSPVPSLPGSLLESKLPEDPGLGSLLDQITYQQGRAQSGEAEC